MAINDQPFIITNKAIRQRYFHRDISYELSNRLEYYFPSNLNNFIGEIDLEYDHDTITHYGNYIAVDTKLKLFKYKFLEPNMYISLGAGDNKHNNYYYGPASNNFGLSTFAAGIKLLAPEYLDRFFAVADIHYFKVLGHENKEALYAKNNISGMAIIISYTQSIETF